MKVMRDATARNRFGLGARPGDASPRDPQAALIAQLRRYEAHPQALAQVPTTAQSAALLTQYLAARRTGREASPDQMQALRQMARGGYATAIGARLISAITTDTPFPERLVHFWSNHFAVSADKLQTIGLAGAYEFEAIRPNILGSFEELLLASVRHPAMMLYLDQAQSIGPQSQIAVRAQRRPQAQPRQIGLNENLAREILELHTLGVDGGYSQADVTELARGLTGWSTGGFVRRPMGVDAAAGSYVFQSAWHEPGSRTLLGRRYPESGEAQGKAMLKALARHPATARHISTKLARHFVSDTPPPALVNRLEKRFLATNGDLPALYKSLVESPEAWATQPSKFKTPWEWTVSSLRALDVASLPKFRGSAMLKELGQPVWRPGSPAGWPDTTADWAAPDAVFRRVEAAARLARLAPATTDARALAPQLLAGTLSDPTATAIARAEDGRQALALLLVSPEFLRR